MRLNTGRIRQRTGQLWHGHVTALTDQFDQKGAMRINLALAARASLWRGSDLSRAPDRKTSARAVSG